MKLLKKLILRFRKDKFIKSFADTEQLTRWGKEKNLYSDWDERTILMSQFIPKNSSVLEFGAARLVLKKHLPKGCSYMPSDIVSRSPDTIVFDLNKDNSSQFEKYDVIFFSGVLEYVNDVKKLIKGLSLKTSKFVVSYAPLENYSNLENRKKNGWVNNYHIKDFINIFEISGFKGVEVANWRGQRIMVFNKIISHET